MSFIGNYRSSLSCLMKFDFSLIKVMSNSDKIQKSMSLKLPQLILKERSVADDMEHISRKNRRNMTM